MAGLLQRKLEYYNLLLDEREYQRLIDEGLAGISRAQQFLDSTRQRKLQAPSLIEQTNLELKHILDQRQALINFEASLTREKHSAGPAKVKTNKWKEKLGDVAYARLVDALGSEEAVAKALSK